MKRIKLEAGEILVGSCLETLREVPSDSVHCCVTSPPFWALRDYTLGKGKKGDPEFDLQLGLEEIPFCHGWENGPRCGKCYVCHMVQVFQEVRRVLHPSGVLWLNLGDSYGSGGRTSYGDHGKTPTKQHTNRGMGGRCDPPRMGTKESGKQLLGIPWRVALALQADGWILRSELPWVKRNCISGGAIVYARTQKGDMPMLVKDMVRLRPETVQLWNGKKWTRCVHFTLTESREGAVELELRNGQRIGTTPEHRWPTQRGLLEARDIRIGDVLDSCRLPEPCLVENPPALPDELIGWFVGFYLAEGNISNKSSVVFSCHKKEVTFFEKCKEVASLFGASCWWWEGAGNVARIHVNGRIPVAILRTYVTGRVAKDKHLSMASWRRSDVFLLAVLHGYLDGDGGWDERSRRWGLGFCNNDMLAADLRCLGARVGASVRLRRCVHIIRGKGKEEDRTYPGWKGRVREPGDSAKVPPGGFVKKPDTEVVAIRMSRARRLWDIGVEDEPHTFALASGVLTHNSMPDSAMDRPTRATENWFLFSKQPHYFFDMHAVRRRAAPSVHVVTDKMGSARQASGAGKKPSGNGVPGAVWETGNYRHFRSADFWFESLEPPHGLVGIGEELVGLDVTVNSFSGAHFATFPESLIRPLILSGTSKKGVCPDCGEPWRRVVEKHRYATRPGLDTKVDLSKRKLPAEEPGRSRGAARFKASTLGSIVGNRDPKRHVTDSRTLGWRPGCKCYGVGLIPKAPKPPGQRTDDYYGIGIPGESPRRGGRAGAMSDPVGQDGGTTEQWDAYEKALAEWRTIRDRLLEEYKPLKTVPAVVLDTFLGSETTALVAIKYGRRFVGCELSQQYVDMSVKRIKKAWANRGLGLT